MNTDTAFLKFNRGDEILNVPLSSILDGGVPVDDNGNELECDGKVYLRSDDNLVSILNTVIEDCNMALDGSWDKSDDGFTATRDLLEKTVAQISLT